jgi:hypothetical protein
MRLGRLVAPLRRTAAFAALLAVLLQLAIAATHHHAVILGGPLTLSGQKTFVTPPEGDSLPAEEDCPICLDLALGTTFILPLGIALDLAPAPDAAPGDIQREREVRTRLAFQSRAPPDCL